MAITNFAQEAFRSTGDQTRTPRQKFNFELILELGSGKSSIIFTRVSSVTAASYTFDTVIMNQYNRKRIIQTRLNYEPITVTFYDTYDNQWHTLMSNYIAHYYNEGQGINVPDTKIKDDSTINQFFDTNWGFTPNSNRYFFSQIKINQAGRVTILNNPIITNMQGDTLDYSESSPIMYTVTFQPESIETKNAKDVQPKSTVTATSAISPPPSPPSGSTSKYDSFESFSADPKVITAVNNTGITFENLWLRYLDLDLKGWLYLLEYYAKF
jgi:hypothetical protein